MEDYFRNLWGRISFRHKLCFISAVITGFVVHIYMLTNKITNIDDIVCVPGVGGGKVLGRWLQETVHDMFSPWSSPALNGIMAILILSVTSCVIVTFLDIKSVTGAVLLSVLIMTLPSTASNMYYMYLAPTFALALLFSVINAYLSVNYRYGWIAGAVLQLLSMACYQAYFGVATSLMVLAIILMFIDGRDITECVRIGIRCIIALVLGLAGYLISLKVVGAELSDYKGLNSIGHASSIDMAEAVIRAYHRVLQYFVTSPESYMTGMATFFNRILVLLFIALLITVLVSKKVFADRVRGLLTCILLLIFPLALGLVYPMAPQLSHASTVMIYSYVVFYFFILTLLERLDIKGDENKTKALKVLAAATVVVLLLESYTTARVINNAYYRSYIAEIRIIQYYNRILVKLEETEGYNYGDPFLIMGGFYPERVPIAAHNMNAELLEDFEGATIEDHLFLHTNRERFLHIWMGIDTGTDDMTVEEKDALMDTAEFKAMPSYPADGCVRKINGVWVIKMNRDDSE